ncbi:formylglycine-generating enzyme family protein [Thermanaerothrix daxensis]|uniref:formylglycine-generating enzyme family protein n=1 Tax=Thermanaerothrix daxensis TaxID=869279 RepID=UPI0006C8EB42|nr:SUMF1/EgtB/PvdO family nonheme iron enzyme [Thermanaerothrix daxensis]
MRHVQFSSICEMIPRLTWGLFCLLGLLGLSACRSSVAEASVLSVDTSIDPEAWVVIPAGPFLAGQFNDQVTLTHSYTIMVTDVTVEQYTRFLNQALADGFVKIEADQLVGFYPGDPFHGAKHEEAISPKNYPFVPLNDPASPFTFDGKIFAPRSGLSNHPMTNVSWFGAWGYCRYYGYRLPTGLEWEKAARGIDGRPYPWGWDLTKANANFYASGDPFEDMRTYGSGTTPVGFYNGETYAGFATLDSPSPYGLYDMAGNVWQWVSDITPGMHYRFMRGGSKDSYPPDLRVWVTNNATPSYYGPGTGFRCVREP